MFHREFFRLNLPFHFPAGSDWLKKEALFLSFLLFLSCYSKIPYDKWDYETRVWYEQGEDRERVFKVFLKQRECFDKLRRGFRVMTLLPSGLLVVKLNREELVELSKDRCVRYVEFQRPVHLK